MLDSDIQPGEQCVVTCKSEHQLFVALDLFEEAGAPVADIYSPYPIHGLEKRLGWRRSRLGFVTFAAGITGAVGALTLQIWTSAIDWPVNVGGKPAASILAFIPITFEVTILAAGLATAGAFVARSKLFPWARGRSPNVRVTDDRFAILFGASSNPAELVRKLEAVGLQSSTPPRETR